MTDDAGVLYLLQVASATFPTGAFAHSLGFETLVAEGQVTDAESLEEQAGLWLRFGLAPLDGVAVSIAYDASAGDDLTMLAALDEAISALKLPCESLEASLATGNAFLHAAEVAFGGERLARYGEAVAAGLCAGHAATAFGVGGVDAGISKREAVLAYLQSSFSNLIGVVARLIPLGQLDVQRIVTRAREALTDCTTLALSRELSSMASSAAFLDLASMRHERLYTRLCIS